MQAATSMTALTIFALAAGAAHAAPCAGLEQFREKQPKLVERLTEAATKHQEVECSSLISVLAKFAGSARSAGRKLEEDKPLNLAEAQQNLDLALQDPVIQEQINKLKADLPDEDVRLLYEAAVLDAEGFYNARELRIKQLRDKLGG